MIPLWAYPAALAIGAAGSYLFDKDNQQNNPYNKPTVPAMDLLNDHIQKEQQRIRADVLGNSGLTPEWADRVSASRADDSYKKWLMNSNEFELGGQTYKWAEANSPEALNNEYVRGRSNDDIAMQYARANHKDPGQYQGSYASLIAEKQRLTGKRYIPIELP